MPPKESNQNLIVAGVAGFFTGGPIGAIASPGVLYLLNRAGMSKAPKWLVWAAIGVIGGPLSLALISPILPKTSSESVAESTPTQTTPKASVGSSQPASVTSAQPRGYQIGDRVQNGDRAITISNIQASNGLTAQNPFAEPIDGQVLLVYFTAENTGNDSGNILFSQFQLTDGQGRSYDEITDLGYTIWRDEQGFKERASDLYPGEKRQDVAVFRIAPGASEFKLQWKGEAINLNESQSGVPNSGSQSTRTVAYNSSPIPSMPEPGTASPSAPEYDYGTLKAKDPQAQINLREQPSSTSKSYSYGIVGDRVRVLKSETNSIGEKWFEVYFEKSNTQGWVRSDFIWLDGAD